MSFWKRAWKSRSSSVSCSPCAAPHDLGVARGDIDIAFERGAAHGLHDTLELRDFHALIQNDIETEIAWRRAAHGEIVHRAVHRERTDIAARKFEWLHGVAVGGEDDFFFARMQSQADGYTCLLC